MKLYVWVFLAGIVVRVGVGTFLLLRADQPGTLEFPDEQQYWQMAQSFAARKGLRDELGFQATRMPLYPAALSLAVRLPNGVIVAKAVQWVLSAMAASLAAAIAARLFSRRAGWLAGLFVACDPFMVFFSSLLLTETVFGVFVLTFFLLSCPLFRGNRSLAMTEWLGVTAAAIASVYVRESALLLVGLTLVIAALVRRDRPTWAGVAVCAALTAAALVPWGLRNRAVTGEWCFLTTRGGISLFDGVHPNATGASDLGEIKRMEAVRGMSESEWNGYFMKESLRAIRAEPMRVLRLAAVKLGRTWNPIPNVDTYRSAGVRLLAAAWTIPTFALAIAGTILACKRTGTGLPAVLFLIVPALYVTILHSLFVGSIRYRLVAVPFIDILAAVAVAMLLARNRGTLSPELTP